jgi:alpha-N-arabinofuranosidase
VGNEAWGCGGNMTPEFYSNLFRQYATFMSGWSNDSHIFRVASGANSEDYHWTETLMKSIPLSLIEGVALHHYSLIDWGHKGSSTKFSEEQYFKVIKSSWEMEELVTRHSAIMDKYDPRKKVALVVDEWGGWYDVEPGTNPGFLYQQNTMRDAVIAGVTLNIFNNHCDRVRMANLAQMVNVLQAVVLTDKAKIVLTPTYHVMEMYNVHQNAKKLPVQLETENYSFGEENLPAVSASASKDSNGTVHISIVNIDANKTKNIVIEIGGNTQYKTISGRILSSANVQDYNSFDNPDKIKPVELKNLHIDNNSINIKIEPFSVVVLELK